MDYYALLGVRRGCTRSELESAHLVLTLKLKPDRSVSFAERLELVDEHRDLEAVRDQARACGREGGRMREKNGGDREERRCAALSSRTGALRPNTEIRRLQVGPYTLQT